MTTLSPNQLGACGPQTKILARMLGALGVVFLMLFSAGCKGDAGVDAALDSDANGYLCLACNAKFYTDRTVFPTQCPDCKKPNIQQAVMFICADDQQVNLGPKSVRSVPCQKCGKPATGLGIPRQTELKAWGAVYKSPTQVN
jgi:DNA-directed RNA polymerase subunit RPC12/RpoP